MRANPLVIEVVAGIARQSKAQLEYLILLAVQAVVLLLWWPKSGVMQMLASQHGPEALIAVVMAMGVATAYHALRAGAEEYLLPGQHGLRDWALTTPLGLGRIVFGFLLGQLVHVLHLLALASPLVLAAFTVSGGEWREVALCMASTLVQAMFYALSGAVMHLTIGQHRAECHFFVRAVLIVVYLPIGWLVPITSHVAFASRTLGDGVPAQGAFSGMLPDPWLFLTLYMGLSMLCALAVYLLLMRCRARQAGPRAGRGEAVTP